MCIRDRVFAAVLMILFIALRFRKIGGWSAGVMAVVALLHDVVMVFAVFTLCRIPLNDNFIAVVLTILGYSINDTLSLIHIWSTPLAPPFGRKTPTPPAMRPSSGCWSRRSPLPI